MTLWLGPDGVPVAADTARKVRAGLLFLNVTNDERVHRELALVSGRLVATRSRVEQRVSGLGQSFDKTVETVAMLECKSP